MIEHINGLTDEQLNGVILMALEVQRNRDKNRFLELVDNVIEAMNKLRNEFPDAKYIKRCDKCCREVNVFDVTPSRAYFSYTQRANHPRQEFDNKSSKK